MAESGQYSRSVLGASDEMKDIYCEPCQRDGNVAIAEGYCVDCPEYLCAQCYKTHRRNKVLVNHVLLDKDSMPISSDANRRVLDICEERCTIHSGKVTEFFCETCDKLGCHVCVTLHHRQCEKVKHIPDISKDLENSVELKAFYEGIKSAANNLSEFEQKIQANVTSNHEMQKLAKQELQHQRAEVNKFFDELEKKMDDQIQQIARRNKNTLKSTSDMLKPMKKDLDQIKNGIESKNSGQNCELFISMKRSKEKMMNFDDQFNKLRNEVKIQRYTLLPSGQIHAMMRTTTEICRMATARLESVIDIQTSKDKAKPSVRCITIMHGHYCVVADNANKTIKVVDTIKKCVTSEVCIEADSIWSIMSVNNDKVVVSVSLSDYKAQQIQFFSVSASGVIQTTKQLYDLNNWYQDMEHHKGNIYGLIVLSKSINNLNMTGKVIRTIRTDEKGAGNQIALSPEGQTIYLTDSKQHSVTSLTLDGKVKAVYTDKDLKDPQGITVDKHGYVYVRDIGTHNIQQLTADLIKVQVLIDDVYGNEITYSSTENKLYINDINNIKEYSLDFN